MSPQQLMPSRCHLDQRSLQPEHPLDGRRSDVTDNFDHDVVGRFAELGEYRLQTFRRLLGERSLGDKGGANALRVVAPEMFDGTTAPIPSIRSALPPAQKYPASDGEPSTRAVVLW